MIVKMASVLTHPEWSQEIGGLEVATAFADRIRGRNGRFYQYYDKLIS